MKKTRRIVCSILAATLCLFATLSLYACAPDPMKTAVKNGDNYTIVASYDPTAHALSVTQVTQYTNRSDNAFTCVKFHIYANAYREGATVVPNTYRPTAYPNGASYGEIAFDNVSVDGAACAYRIEGDNCDILSVPLAKELFPDDKVCIEMTYNVTLANIKHRLGYTDNAVVCGNFFPVVCHVVNNDFDATPYCAIGDPFVSDCANFDVTIRTPQSYTVAASGTLNNVTSENGYDTWHFEGQAMRDFAMVLSDKYKKLTKKVATTQVNYFYYADEDAEGSLATACASLEYFDKNIGTYPYEQYNVCETDFCYGGMEYPALVLIASGGKAYTEAIVHETAHQWFYGVVGNDQIRNAWMDEGLAEFLTCLYLDNANVQPLAASVKMLTKTYITYVDVLNRYYDHADTSFRALTDYKNDGEYVVMTYTKGSLLFATLYETMGETKFFKALRDYYKQNAFTIATPQDMTDSFVRCGNKELATVFEKFATGQEILGKVTD